MKQKAPKTGKTVVQFKIPGRTVYNLSHPVHFDTRAGIINLVNSYLCVPRQRYEFNLRSTIKTFPAKAPIIGSFKARVYAFYVPLRLYIPELRLNDMTGQQPLTGARNFTGAPLPQYSPTISVESVDQWYINDAANSSQDAISPYSVESVLEVHSGSLLEQCGMAQKTFSDAISLATYGKILYNLATDFQGDSITDAIDNADASNLPNTFGNNGMIEASKILAYYDIFRNYFANPNERGYPVFFNDPTYNKTVKYDSAGQLLPFESDKFSAVGARPILQLLPLDDLQDYYNTQAWVDDTIIGNATPVRLINHYNLTSNQQKTLPFTDARLTSCRNAGLCTKCYLPDINSTFIGSAQYEKVIAESIVKVTDGDLNMQDLLVGQKMFNYFQKLAATGSRYDEFVRAEYGIDIRKYLDIPTFLRTWTFPVEFGDVFSQNAFAEDSSNGLGQRAGIGGGLMDHDPENQFNFSVDEPSLVIFLMTIEPLPVYADGIDWTLLNSRFDDIYTPSLDRMGMQPMFLSQVASNLPTKNVIEQALSGSSSFSSPDPMESVIGYVPAWQEYKTRVGRAMGSLANEMSYWVLLRDATQTIPVSPAVPNQWTPEYTSYIIPSMYNSPFQDTTEDGNPFIVDMSFDVLVKSPMSAASMTGFAEGSL